MPDGSPNRRCGFATKINWPRNRSARRTLGITRMVCRISLSHRAGSRNCRTGTTCPNANCEPGAWFAECFGPTERGAGIAGPHRQVQTQTARATVRHDIQLGVTDDGGPVHLPVDTIFAGGHRRRPPPRCHPAARRSVIATSFCTVLTLRTVPFASCAGMFSFDRPMPSG